MDFIPNSSQIKNKEDKQISVLGRAVHHLEIPMAPPQDAAHYSLNCILLTLPT